MKPRGRTKKVLFKIKYDASKGLATSPRFTYYDHYSGILNTSNKINRPNLYYDPVVHSSESSLVIFDASRKIGRKGRNLILIQSQIPLSIMITRGKSASEEDNVGRKFGICSDDIDAK